MDQRAMRLDRCEMQGRTAAAMGKPYGNNPYIRNTAEFLAWSKGHNNQRVMEACHRQEYPAIFERSHPTPDDE